MIRGQCAARFRSLRRFEVRENVRATEGVDRLLGVPDQEEPSALFGPENTREDPVLHRVGVLELVDQRHVVASPHRPGQALAPGIAQRAVELVEQIVERLDLRLGELGER